jgi:hypothetical protein
VIEKVLEAARFAPSGHNEQTTEFVVIRGKQKVREIAMVTAECLGRQAKQYQNPIAQMVMRLIMGYPRLKFKAWPERHPAKVTWLGAE